MTRGLVIGKFMPVHAGHIALIEFAATRCDQLIVLMSYKHDDAIPHQQRLSWLVDTFKFRSNIIVCDIEDNFDREDLPLDDRTKIWASVISKKYGQVDVVCSSEEYGEPFAKHLRARHAMFDRERSKIPVSASLIRTKPFRYWQYIPHIVRPYFVKKICFYGPESTGKSTMAAKMAKLFNTEWVPEVAREFITSNTFTLADIETIAAEHYKRISEKTKTANKILICDTDAITTAIYSRYYLGTVPPIVQELEKKARFDLYFLFDVDVEWVADGLRDLQGHRTEMFDIFRQELVTRGIGFQLVSGNYEERERYVAEKLNELLSD